MIAYLSILEQSEKSVREELSKSLNQFFGVIWRSHALSGFGSIDVYATLSEFVCIVEAELKRADPVNNVAKIYRYLEEKGSEFEGKKLIFIHAFSPYYDKGGALTKKKNAEFVGNKMSKEYKDLAYVSIEFDSMESLKNRVVSAIKARI